MTARAPVTRTSASDRVARLLAVIPWIAANDGPTLDEICDRFAVSQQADQDRGHRRTGRVVEGPVDGIDDPHQGRGEVGSAEFLAVDADSGRGLQLRHQLAFQSKIHLGGEVVAFFLHRRLRPVPGNKRHRGPVQNHPGFGDECLQVGHVSGSPPPALRAG